METRGRGTAVLLAVLAVAATIVLVADADGRPADDRTAAFQQLVGGLGLGPAVALGGCEFGFDPRLDGACAADLGPVPGGACFCGRHTGLLDYAPRVSNPGGDHPRTR